MCMAEMPILECKRFHSPWRPVYEGRSWVEVGEMKMKKNESERKRNLMKLVGMVVRGKERILCAVVGVTGCSWL